MDPPSVLISVNNDASISAVLLEGAPFAVNVLPQGFEDLANRCAGAVKGEDRFATHMWHASPAGVPFLTEAQAAIVCKNDATLAYGTHTIFVGRVTEVFGDGQRNPLIYFNGRYAPSVV